MMKRLLLVLLALLLIPTGYVCAGTMVADLSNLDIWLIGFDRTPVQGEMTPCEGYFSHQGLQLTYEVYEQQAAGVHPRVFVETRFSAQDWTKAEYLTYWVKVDENSRGTSLSTMVFGPQGSKLIRQSLSNYMSGDWQKVVIPLADYAEVGLGAVTSVRIVVEGIYGAGSSGSLILDALFLEEAEPTLDVTVEERNGVLYIDVVSQEPLPLLPKVRLMDVRALLGIGQPIYVEVERVSATEFQATYTLANERQFTVEVVSPGNPTVSAEWTR